MASCVRSIKRTLLLTDRGFRNLRADIVGTVRQQFDITNLAGTLTAPIERWIRDLGVDLKLCLRSYRSKHLRHIIGS